MDEPTSKASILHTGGGGGGGQLREKGMGDGMH